MDFNCSGSDNWYENYRIAMVFMGVFVTFINELRQYEKSGLKNFTVK